MFPPGNGDEYSSIEYDFDLNEFLYQDEELQMTLTSLFSSSQNFFAKYVNDER